jgi:hypothetical protein
MVLSNIGRVCRRPFKAFLQQCKKAFFVLKFDGSNI